jgi:hypothetical protein
MCSTCGDVLTNASEHNDGCGDGELEWRVADAPFELLGDMPLETMARARAVKTSRKLNRRATHLVTSLKSKLALYLVDMERDDTRAEGACKLFFMMDAMLLNLKRDGLSTTAAVVSRCYNLAENDREAWLELLEPITGYRPRRESHLDKANAAFRRADGLAKDGELSQAAQAVYGAGVESIATSSLHNDRIFMDKFNHRDNSSHLELDLDQEQLIAPPDDVIVAALSSLKRSKAAGPFGDTREGLGFITDTALCKLVKVCFTYTLPDCFHELAGVSFGFKFSKPGGGIRPINVSTAFHKLLSKVLVRWGLSDLVQRYRATAKGIGESAGMEVILHMLDFMMCDSYSEQDNQYGLCLLKTDIKNCFNSLKRDKLFDILGEHGFGPRMGAVKSLLGHTNTIMHVDYQGQTKIAMQVNDGIFQGSPASGLFVTMAIQHQLTDVRSKYLESGDVPGVMFSYLDDITVCADLGTLTSVFPIMKQALAEVGFEVSLEKTTLVTFNTDVDNEHEAAAGLGIAIEEGSTELLGSVLYRDCQSAVDYLDQLDDEWIRQARNLVKYTEADEPYRLQVALRILRQSFSAKPGYISRCLPPHLTKQPLEEFNQDLLVELLSHIARVDHVNTLGELHASLPTKLGGLGLVNAADQIYAAYYSSWNDVLKQVFDGAVPAYLVQRFSGLRAKYSSFRWPKRIYDNLNTTRAGLIGQIEQLAELRATTQSSGMILA